MTQSESVLLAKYAEHRDPSAFRALVERHQGMVFGVCNRILRNASDAEDVAQECFLRLAQKAVGLRAPITGWLHRVAVQTSIDLARRDRARHEREKRVREAARQPGDTVAWEDLMAHVDEALVQLKGVELYLRKGASGWRIISQELGDEQTDKMKAMASEMPIVKHWRQYAGMDVPAPGPDATIEDVSSLDLGKLGLRQVGVIEGPLEVTLDGRTFKFARALERRAVMCSDDRGRQYELYFARAEDAATAKSICKDAFPAVQMAPVPIKMSSGVLFLSRTGHRSNLFFCSGPWVTVVSISILPPSGKTVQEIQLSHDVLEEERIGLELLGIFAEHYRGL